MNATSWNVEALDTMLTCEITLQNAEDMTNAYVNTLKTEASVIGPLLRKGRPVVGSDHEAIAQHVFARFVAAGRTDGAATTARTRFFGLIKYVHAFPCAKNEDAKKFALRVINARAVVNSGTPDQVKALMAGKAASSKRPGAAAAAAKRAADAKAKADAAAAAAAAANASVVNGTNTDPAVTTTTTVTPVDATPRVATLDDLKGAVAEFIEASRKVSEMVAALNAAGVKIPKAITSLAESAATTTAKAMIA